MSGMKEWQHLKIPFTDIQIATKNFQKCIGKGGYGFVYEGELPIHGKHRKVAVKRLGKYLGQGLKEFLTEIQSLFGQDHPNLISLLGYYDEGNEKIIVYEFAARGSLDQYIRRNNTIYTLSWLERLKICVDAARGLNQLHNHVGRHQAILHRDVKSANILIDEKWNAKISDLGLSKLSLTGLGRSAVISYACGTPGYCEPEYIITGIVTKKSDVYSFGMVLFKVLCGRLCTVRDDDGFLLSGQLAKDYYKRNKVAEIVDPTLKEQMSLASMNRFSEIAYRCLKNDRQQRPSMDVVAKELEKLLDFQRTGTEPNLSTSGADGQGQESVIDKPSPPTTYLEANVFVNGQPLTSHLVKKAEKLAGPIQPGHYWYDSVAGFWGVMNQQCRGIIPAHIKEFEHPMPKNCAAGNTSVFVNGRELTDSDLDLLARRGLPTVKDKSYIINIFGKVMNEDTGEELYNLGKLAPTVEKRRHGFGMKGPRVASKNMDF